MKTKPWELPGSPESQVEPPPTKDELKAEAKAERHEIIEMIANIEAEIANRRLIQDFYESERVTASPQNYEVDSRMNLERVDELLRLLGSCQELKRLYERQAGMN